MNNVYLKIFGIVTTIGMIIVLIQGVLVTQTGSGDACGAEWPLCLGQVFPESPTVQTMIEYTHRVVSGLLGIMVIILSIWSWKRLSHIRETKFFAVLAVAFIVFQGLLGAAAVVWGQSSAVMALHFGFSLISFASVMLLSLLAFEEDKSQAFDKPSLPASLRNYIYFVLCYLYIVVYTGALVKHTNSSAACSGWPLCNGQWIPPLEGRVAVQFGHRAAASLLFFAILILFIWVVRHYKQQKSIYYSSLVSLLFVTIQVISGAVVVFTGFSLATTMFHAVFASMLFGILSYTALLAYRSKQI
ncbi:cytochrome c oxidase assembly protein subunit 15 [Evansella vedderi]|uniref:Heme A synthase n=1 Tax=Evansella vedderi TaxID=38282 RepID=A0ABU0A085_9BACI|nr:heme A synthase [Evansella vedderi]MDQ0256422.1 cytochrome c oxidase assembly protein subunit 15 [Evansella vedderi]